MVFAAGCGQDAVIDDDTPDETIHTPTEDEADENGVALRVNPSGSEDHYDGYLPPEIPVLSEGWDFDYTLDNREVGDKVDKGYFSFHTHNYLALLQEKVLMSRI